MQVCKLMCEAVWRVEILLTMDNESEYLVEAS
jgi:hypothetical protein